MTSRFLTLDHPRVCGEKDHRAHKRAGLVGSPPRVRGEVFLCDPAICHPRITPACAGRRPPHAGRTVCSSDHPRVCGEKTIPGINTEVEAGSPPRVRGEEAIEAPTAAIPRITPACAGRRRFGSPRGPRSEDHPRVCGEKEIIRRYGDEDGGSPPRVRGEASLVDSIPARTGITPACAGRSRKSLARTAGVEDHPRVCGEKCRTPKLS